MKKIEVGQLVKVIRIEGVKLVVKPTDNQEEQ